MNRIFELIWGRIVNSTSPVTAGAVIRDLCAMAKSEATIAPEAIAAMIIVVAEEASRMVYGSFHASEYNEPVKAAISELLGDDWGSAVSALPNPKDSLLQEMEQALDEGSDKHLMFVDYRALENPADVTVVAVEVNPSTKTAKIYGIPSGDGCMVVTYRPIMRPSWRSVDGG